MGSVSWLPPSSAMLSAETCCEADFSPYYLNFCGHNKGGSQLFLCKKGWAIEITEVFKKLFFAVSFS